MSRGGRGGRGGGQNKSFSQEQLGALGVASHEGVPGPVTQPPPLFPLLDHKPIPLQMHDHLEYQVMWKQEFIEFLKDSPAYIKEQKKEVCNRSVDQIEKLLAQIPKEKNEFNWNLFPAELRPKMIAKRRQTTPDGQTEVEIAERLEMLEKLEKSIAPRVKEEPDDYNETEEAMQDEADEEMDDGTDYANNYFDNGEGYEEEDDNLDDGPCY